MSRQIDIHEYDRLYGNARNGVARADISEANKTVILKFDKACGLENLSLSRRIRILRTLVMMAKMLDREFEKATKDHLQNLVVRIDENAEWEPSTKHTHKAILKKFCKWLKYGDDYKTVQGYPKEIAWLRVTIKGKDKPKVKAADILTEQEIDSLLKAAEHPRDKAFIAMLYELGARIGEIGGLRIKNVSRDEYSFIVDLKGKTGHRTPRIVMSDPYLSAWLNAHPLKDDPNAPLWTLLGDRNKNEKMLYRHSVPSCLG